MLRIRLIWVFIVVSLLTLGLAYAVESGKRNADFEVVTNDLEIGPDGRVYGQLKCNYNGPNASQRPFLFSIDKIARPSLVELKPGDTHRVSFQYAPVWPLKKQDPFLRYIERGLEIDPDCIQGYVMTLENTQVILQGTAGRK